MQCPQPFLGTVTALILLVLRHLHANTLGERSDSIRIAQALDLHLKIDDTATLVATKTVVNALIGRDRKGSGF